MVGCVVLRVCVRMCLCCVQGGSLSKSWLSLSRTGHFGQGPDRDQVKGTAGDAGFQRRRLGGNKPLGERVRGSCCLTTVQVNGRRRVRVCCDAFSLRGPVVLKQRVWLTEKGARCPSMPLSVISLDRPGFQAGGTVLAGRAATQATRAGDANEEERRAAIQ